MDNKEMDKELDLDLDLIEDEDFKKSVQTLDAQKKHWREKAKKESEEKAELLRKLQEIEGKSNLNKKVEEKDISEDSNKIAKLESELQKIRLATKNYSDEEIDFIVRSGGNPDDVYVKAAIDKIRSEKKSVDAAPDGSNKSPIHNKYTEEQIKKMSSSEMEKILKER